MRPCGEVHSAGWLAAGLLILFAISVRDLTDRRVPNALVIAGTALGLAWWAAVMGGSGLGYSVLAAVVVAAPLLAVHALGLLGAADVKVGFACGAMVGPRNLLALLQGSMLAGLLLSLAYLCWQEKFRWRGCIGRLLSPAGALARARCRGETIPFTVCLSVGVLWASRVGHLWCR